MVHSPQAAHTHREAETAVVDDGGWIEWAGGERPVGKYTIVGVRRRDGATLTDTAFKFDWGRLLSGPDPSDLVAYRPA